MIRNIILLVLCFVSLKLFSQVVYTDPGLPSDANAATVYFNASDGSGGLENFSGDIYAHTGVLTNLSTSSSDWKYVKAGWTENITACKLTRISTNLYSLTLTPDIRKYYGVSDSENIQKLAFVFRSDDGSKIGKGDGNTDIFVNVSTGEFAVIITAPDKNIRAINKKDLVQFKASASQVSTITLNINGTTVFGAKGLNLSYPYVFNESGSYTIVVKAVAGEETRKDSVVILVQDAPEEMPVPKGAEDGINYNSSTDVTLVLHAPGKQNIYLLGDFNNWTPDNAYQLKRDGDKWWITLSNLTMDKEYGYQYLVDGKLKIADPYAELVLDPWNDPYITPSVFPNIKSYPTGLTEGIVGVFEIKSTEFPWREIAYTVPPKEDLIIYELHIRDFVSSHRIVDVKEKLDYLENLGINAIELMPFNEFEGNTSWGYNPSFYFAPDKYYGTPDNLKAFIDECHVRGIAVIMDMVLNHSFSQSPLVQLYFDESTSKVSADNPWYNVDSPNQVYQWGYDFNHEAPATKYFVDRVLKYWLQEYHIDGFRLDFTKGFTNKAGDGWAYDASRISILSRIYFVMQSAKPKSLMICEHLADNSEEKILSSLGILLWGNMNYSYNESTMGYVSTSDLSGTSYKNRGWANPHLISYMESHDEERLMYKNMQFGNIQGDYSIKTLETGLERNKLAATFFFSIPGPKMIWQFGELGYDFSIDYNGRVGEKPIRWDYNDDPLREALRDHYATMMHLKTTNDVFRTSDFSLHVGTYGDKQITLRSDDVDVSVLGNFGMLSAPVNPNFTKNGWWYEYFSGDSMNVTSTSSPLTMSAGEYRIYSTKKLALADVHTDIKKKNVDDGLLVYPNPTTAKITISSPSQISSFELYDFTGRLILFEMSDSKKIDLNLTQYMPGIYLVKLNTAKGIISRPIIKR